MNKKFIKENSDKILGDKNKYDASTSGSYVIAL
jgi:hypothetical protein